MDSWLVKNLPSDYVLMNNEFPVTVGLDFGTSNSCIAFWREDRDRVKIVKNDNPVQRSKLTASTITFHKSFQDVTIGNEISPPELTRDSDKINTLFGLKRLLGLDSLNGVPEHLKPLCSIRENTDGSKEILIECKNLQGDTQEFTTEELCSKILSYLHTMTLAYFEKKMQHMSNGKPKIVGVVLGIPAYFPERYKTSLQQAAITAGFPANGISYMIESTAAAMAYGLTVAGKKTMLVIDIGGGTTDITIFQLTPGTEMQILYTGGHRQLGGQDVDMIVYEQIVKLLLTKVINVSQNEQDILQKAFYPTANTTSSVRIYPRLLAMCRDCKEQLSTNMEYVLPAEVLSSFLHSLLSNQSTPSTAATVVSPSLLITRQMLQDWIVTIAGLLYRVVAESIQHFLSHSTATTDDKKADHSTVMRKVIDEIIVVGGSSRIPLFQSTICNAHNDTISSSDTTSSNKETSSEGTSIHFITSNIIQSRAQEDSNEELNDKNEYSSKKNASNQSLQQSKNKKKKKQNRPEQQELQVIERELCTSINPDYAIVEGLAIRGAIITSHIQQHAEGNQASTTGTVSTDPSSKLAHLKHVLMMDCLPMTIGILLSSNDAETTSKYFEPILFQGQALPIQRHAVQQFALANRNQSFVTLEIYEEIEEFVYAPTAQHSEEEKGETGEKQTESSVIGRDEDWQKKYSYYLLVTTDVPIIRIQKKTLKEDSPLFVNVYMQVNEEGVLSYDIVEAEEEKEGTESASRQERIQEHMKQRSTVQSFLLTALIVLLFVLYVIFKIVLSNHNPLTAEESPSTMDSMEEMNTASTVNMPLLSPENNT